MKTEKEIFRWLRANCGKQCLSGLSSTDTYALVTSVSLTKLISYESAPDWVFEAYGAIVREMQPNMRWLAYHAIAIGLDWSHRAMIWERAGLPVGDKPGSMASFEPGGLGQDLSKKRENRPLVWEGGAQ